ncbi:MAG: hypothetical protein PHF86_06445 [Candidatus Nanoarchaeia archaeon]|jgi:SAM-dependent methyltransferase|nr:hypothetical protein [Candidatus Nanoarchaeia archaeon]
MIFLEQLARKYKTDKLDHGFIDIYDIYLAQKNVKTMLEIGVYEGDSLKMWSEYFPNAKVFGWDIKNYALDAFGLKINTFHVNQEDRISIVQAIDFMGGHEVKFDLIIDDGSHTMMGQQLSLALLWPTLAPGGIYIVEDLHTSLPHNPHEWAGGKCLPDFSNSSLKALQSLQNTGKIESVYLNDEQKEKINSECFRCRIHDMKNDERHITAVLIKKDGGDCGQHI